MSASVCRSCEREIIWAETASGKRMPLDASASLDGDWATAAGKCHRYTDEDARLKRTRHTAHWATCPDAASFRRGRK